MNKSPRYPGIRMTFLIQNPPPVILVAALGAALENGGIERKEVDRILDDVVSVEPTEIMGACAKYVQIR